MDKKGPLSPDTTKAIKDLIKIFGDFGKEVIYKWAITQSLSFTDQLKAGIRYFDLRVATKEETEDLYFAHNLYGHKIEDSMNEIKQFLDEHPKEIVLLDFNHFYGMTEFKHKQFLSLLLEIFGYRMCPFIDTESVTLEMLWESELQVIIFYHSCLVTEYLQFWPGCQMPSPWADTTDLNELLSFLEDNIKAGRPEDTFYVSQGVLTPSTSFVLAHLASSLKDSLDLKVVEPFVSWVKKQHIGGKNGVNIFIMDCCNLGNYANSVIELNYKH